MLILMEHPISLSLLNSVTDLIYVVEDNNAEAWIVNDNEMKKHSFTVLEKYGFGPKFNKLGRGNESCKKVEFHVQI